MWRQVSSSQCCCQPRTRSLLFFLCFLEFCFFRVSGIDSGDDVSKWLSSFLKQKCRLIRQNPKVVRRNNLNQGIHDCMKCHNMSHFLSFNTGKLAQNSWKEHQSKDINVKSSSFCDRHYKTKIIVVSVLSDVTGKSYFLESRETVCFVDPRQLMFETWIVEGPRSFVGFLNSLTLFPIDDCNTVHALSLANNSQLVVITEASCLHLLRNMKSSVPSGEV